MKRGARSIEPHVHKNNTEVGDPSTCVDISLRDISDKASRQINKQQTASENGNSYT